MGDDLISREKALEVVKRHMCDSANIEQGILELPTAYSIAKVVKQINEERGMERLTKRNGQNTKYYYPKCFEKCGGNGNSANCNSCELEDMICEKLGRYEDLEEQGLLLRLPCKVGDTVYRICPKCDNDHDGSCKNCAWEGTAGMKGCTVYGLWRDGQYPPDKCTIVPYKVTWNYVPNLLHNIGKTVFLTREEVEAALHVQGGITVKQDNYIKND